MKQRLPWEILGVLVLVAASVIAQDRVTVSFSNTWQNGATTYLMPGNTTITFTTSIFTAPVKGGTNGFRIWIPEGGAFGPVSGSFPAQPGWDGGCFANHLSCDGIGADTVGFGGFAIVGSGLPVGTNVYYTASLNVPADLAEKHLCIDTAFYPPGGVWLWSTDGGDVVPDWYDQPYCLTIYGCAPGKLFSNWPEATLTYDHCGLATYDFDTPDEANGLAAYTMMGGPGSVDPVTGVWSYQPSLADVGQVRTISISAYGCDAWGFDVAFTNQAPTITCKAPVICGVGVPFSTTISKNDVDCDNGTFSIVEVNPQPAGPHSIDATTGVLSFTAAPADAMQDFAFTVQYSDGKLNAACIQHIQPIDQGTCCQLRGDIDGNGSGPNVSDLTMFVNVLFRGMGPFRCEDEADVNDDQFLNVSDLTFLVDYLFRDGPEPYPCPWRQ